MSRGAKKDVAVSKLLFRNGIFLDRRSFVSLNGNEPHLFLKGADMAAQRDRVWKKATKAGEPAPRCKLKLEGCDYYAAELDHKQGGLVGRFDDKENLQPACISCHRKKHVSVKFSKKQAVKDFNKLYPTQETADGSEPS